MAQIFAWINRYSKKDVGFEISGKNYNGNKFLNIFNYKNKK